VPFAQGYQGNGPVPRAAGQPAPGSAAALLDAVRREIREAAPGLPVFKIRTFRPAP
jgi:hypothetical protein